jgi:hypothetical protein
MMVDVEKLAHETLDRVTQECWAKGVRHAEELQEVHYAKQSERNNIEQPIIMRLAESVDDRRETDRQQESSFDD